MKFLDKWEKKSNLLSSGQLCVVSCGPGDKVKPLYDNSSFVQSLPVGPVQVGKVQRLKQTRCKRKIRDEPQSGMG